MDYICREALEMMKKRREELKMTPTEVARAAGFKSRDHYVIIEDLRTMPKLNQLPQIARALQFNVRSFCIYWLHILHPEFAEAVFGRNAYSPRSCGDPPDNASE